MAVATVTGGFFVCILIHGTCGARYMSQAPDSTIAVVCCEVVLQGWILSFVDVITCEEGEGGL